LFFSPAEMAEMAEIAMLNIYLPYLLFQRDNHNHSRDNHNHSRDIINLSV